MLQGMGNSDRYGVGQDELDFKQHRDMFAPTTYHLSPCTELVLGSSPSFGLRDYLPPEIVCDFLLSRYFAVVHPVSKVVHRGTLEAYYREFWDIVRSGSEPVPSLQALVFAVSFSAAATLNATEYTTRFSDSFCQRFKDLQYGTELSLAKADIARTTELQTFEAFMIYLTATFRGEISRKHSILVSAAIRVGRSLGLNNEPQLEGLNFIETQIRRTLWYQLCMLDLRTAHAYGPHPEISPDEYSTELPVNINDADLTTGDVFYVDRPEYTDMTFVLIMFEGYETQRTLHLEQTGMARNDVNLQNALCKITNFKGMMDAKYIPMFTCSDHAPTKQAAEVMLHMLISRCFVMVLSSYDMCSEPPSQWRQMNLDWGTLMLQSAIQLKTTPQFQLFAPLLPVTVHLNAALLLLGDITRRPLSPEADRLWSLYDCLFEFPRRLAEPPAQALADTYKTPSGVQDLRSRRGAKSYILLWRLKQRLNMFFGTPRLQPIVGNSLLVGEGPSSDDDADDDVSQLDSDDDDDDDFGNSDPAGNNGDVNANQTIPSEAESLMPTDVLENIDSANVNQDEEPTPIYPQIVDPQETFIQTPAFFRRTIEPEQPVVPQQTAVSQEQPAVYQTIEPHEQLTVAGQTDQLEEFDSFDLTYIPEQQIALEFFPLEHDYHLACD